MKEKGGKKNFKPAERPPSSAAARRRGRPWTSGTAFLTARLDLIGKNTNILRSILREITARDFGGILLVVTNPVDVLTYAARKLSGYPRERVVGSGTVLDTGRLKQLLGVKLNVDSELPVSAVLEGEYGLEELALSVPSIVSRSGLQEVLEMPLGGEERVALETSAERMKEAIGTLSL